MLTTTRRVARAVDRRARALRLATSVLPLPAPSRAVAVVRTHDHHQQHRFASWWQRVVPWPSTSTSTSTSASATKSASASRPPPPPLPDVQLIRVENVPGIEDCTLEYVEEYTNPDARGQVASETLVLVHGAPGTYEDFRHMIPQLKQQYLMAQQDCEQDRHRNVRLLAITLPGYGDSATVHARNQTTKGQRGAQARLVALANAHASSVAAWHAIRHLCSDTERVFLVGHSFGGHTALEVAGLNHAAITAAATTGTESTGPSPSPPPAVLNVCGLVLLASAGLHPHRAVRANAPEGLRQRGHPWIVNMLRSSSPLVYETLPPVIKFLYTTLLRFPKRFPESHYITGVVRACTTDFANIQRTVKQLQDANVPTFSAWTRNDEHMETAIPEGLANALRASRCLVFQRGGHNLQKTRADVLAREIVAWTSQPEQMRPTVGATGAAVAELHP